MEKKEGKIPINVRVDIDYTRKKPKIKFGYPTKTPKKEAMSQHSYGIHTLIIMIVLFFLYLIMVAYQIDFNYPQECNVSLNEGFVNVSISVIGSEDGVNYNSSRQINRTFVKGAYFTCDGKDYEVYFKKSIYLFKLEGVGFYYESLNDNWDLLDDVFMTSIFFLFITIGYYLNKLTTFLLLKSNWYVKNNPIFQANLLPRRRYYKFQTKDVENNMVEIPSFSNVELDYNTKGEFSKYLERIKIREHKHHKYKMKKGKRKIGKLERNQFKFYARFYFKQKPEDGYLEVIYQ